MTRPSAPQSGAITPPPEASAMGAEGATTLLGMRQQLVLAAYWFSLSFHGGALLGVAVPAQLLGLTTNADKTWTLGVLGGCASLAGMLAQPIAGALSDLSRLRWGRRRPYLLGGAVLDLVGLGLMAISTNLATLFVGAILAMCGSSISGAAYQAYVPDHVPPSQYGEASGYIGAMTMFGTVISFGLAGLLVAPGAATPFYLATIAIIAAGVTLTAVAIPEPAAPRAVRPSDVTWRSLWLAPWRHANFVLVFATRAMMMLALYTLFTFVEYYVRDVLHVREFVQGAALVAGVATLAAVGGGILTGWLSDRIGRKPIVSAASVLMAGALSLLAVAHNVNVVLGIGVVFGIALGAFAAVDWALAIDVLPDRGFAAKDLGLWGLSTNLPQTLAPFVGGAVLVALASRGAAAGFAALFLGAACCAAVSGALVWRLRGVR